MFELDRNKQKIIIEGISYTKEDILGGVPAFANESDFGLEVYEVLKDWFLDTDEILLHTSGSTGMPKIIKGNKEQMMQSAKLTCSFLDLKEGDTALLCLPVSAIAGKMVLVRALIAGLNVYLVSPCGNPLKDFDYDIVFAAMVPMQAFVSLQSKTEKKRFEKISNVIIGGGAIDKQLESALKPLSNNIYSTYGMTETLSHIALRRINGSSSSLNYTPFQSVKISLSADGCLIIDAPLVSKKRLLTNDLAEINYDGSFRIIGRKDNVINTGGIKIQIEELEEKLRSIIESKFAITSRPDAKFGEVIILMSEAEVDKDKMKTLLSPFEIPKDIILVDKLPLTRTGKIDRKALKRMIPNV
ncbi:MAG: AMP-binding protein [Dysgonomonas sp.]